MSLRAFILSVSAAIMLGIVALFYFQSQRILGGAFEDLETVHLNTVAQTTKSLIETKKFSLRTYRSVLENNNSLSSVLLVASAHHAASKIVAKLTEVEKQVKCDIVDFIPYHGKPVRFPELSALFEKAGQWKLGIVEKELSLISFSPVRHYGEVIGHLALGYRLNGQLAQEITNTTQVKVHFTLAEKTELPASAPFRLVDIDDNVNPPLKVRAEIETNFVASVNESTRSGITWLGIMSLLLVLFLVYVLLEFGFVRSFTKLLSSISQVASDLDRGVVGETSAIRHPIQEVDHLGLAFSKFSSSLKSFRERIESQSRASAYAEVAEQVAHDLKSPLSALDMMLAPDNLVELPENRRNRIAACIQRIKDTLRVLSEKKGDKAMATLSLSPTADREAVSQDKGIELIASLIEGIVHEKRVQYRNLSKVTITLHTSKEAHFVFAAIHSNDFKRALSNLIDNAVQALPPTGGKVEIFLESDSGFFHALIKDNGKGIPEALLGKLGNRGATFGKEGGSGLGLWYAKTVAEAAQGRLAIKSREGVGTDITLTLPVAKTPHWFLPKIRLTAHSTLVIVDDDPSIHEMWIQKLGSVTSDLHCVHLRSGKELESWMASRLSSELDKAFFLFDYELGSETKNGLDYIAKYRLGEKSVLVTSHYEKIEIREKAQSLGVRLIPKGISGFVPIEIRRGSTFPGRAPLAVLLLGVVFASPEARAFTLSDLQLLNSANFTFSKPPTNYRQTVAIHTFYSVKGQERKDKADLIFAILREKLGRSSIRSAPGNDEALRIFRQRVDASTSGPRKIEGSLAKLVLQPRLFVRFEAVPQQGGKQLALQGFLWLLAQEPDSQSFDGSSQKIIFSRAFHVRDLNEPEIFEKLVYTLREGIEEFVPFFKKWREEPVHYSASKSKLTLTSHYQARELPHWQASEERPASVGSSVGGESSAVAGSYATGRYLQLGASVGTPAMANLHAGLWGTPSLPLMVHLSGMYYSPETRGAQCDLGYIFDRNGSYQQALGLSSALFNESRTETNVISDTTRNNTQVIHIHDVKPFIGATYTSQWGPLRFQAGASWRIGQGEGQSTRFLIQAGFVPLIPF